MSIRRLAVLCTAMLCAGMLVLCRVFWIAADQKLCRQRGGTDRQRNRAPPSGAAIFMIG